MCALIIFQEAKVPLHHSSANFTPMGHRVRWQGGGTISSSRTMVLFTTGPPTYSTWNLSVPFVLELSCFLGPISYPDKIHFLCSPLSLADIFCLFPILLELVVGYKTEQQPRLTLTLGAIHSLYVLKLVCLLGFLEKSLAMGVLFHTLHSSWKEVCAFLHDLGG